MTLENDEFYIGQSPLDYERFGINIAKSHLCSVEDMEKALAFCRQHAVEMLIVRCHVDLIDVVHSLEQTNAQLMDTLVYFSRDLNIDPDLEEPPFLLSAHHIIREMRPGEENEIVEIARKAFRGYRGHYYVDPRLPRSASDEIYPDWAYRSCHSTEMADKIFVACIDHRIAGFLTVKNTEMNGAQFVLNAVHPEYRQRGMHHSLILHGLNYAKEHRIPKAYSSTQAFNRRVQRVWSRLGMLPDKMHYTFHLWFQ